MARLTSPEDVTFICPDPPIIDPYIDKTNQKVENPMSIAKLLVEILKHFPSNEYWAINDKYEMYTDTNEVVNKLFCGLKLKNWSIGKITRIKVVMTFSHTNELHSIPSSSAAENLTYPYTFIKTAIL